MERIGVRELRQHASRYLQRIKAGETIEVTERGKLVALLVPPSPVDAERELLISSGRLIPSSQPFQIPQPVSAGNESPDSGTVLDELREDRL